MVILLIFACIGGATCANSEEPAFSSNIYHAAETSSYQYIKEPLAKLSDPTGPSKKLVEFTRNEFLIPEILKVSDNVYVAIGWALANSIMIEGNDGLIIVDTTENRESMKDILAEFRKITNKPVKAVVVTHCHGDHHLGTSVVIEEGKRLYPNIKIEIYSHQLTKKIFLSLYPLTEAGTTRAVRQFGTALQKDEEARTGAGIGPEVHLWGDDFPQEITIPTITYVGRTRYNVSGTEFELIHTPGETEDQTTVWFPREKVVLVGDNIYKTFPNLYAIRGQARNVQKWYQSLDIVHSLGAKYMIGSHTRPVEGTDAVYDTVLVYRDALKYLHDQTLRLINKGYFPGQIVEQIQLPESVSKHAFLQEHYGTVEWSVRSIFADYLGWFSGNPRDLHPMTELDRSVRMVKLITYAQTRKECAVEVMLQQAEIAHKESHNNYRSTGKHITGNDKWALELADQVLELDGLDPEIIHTAKQIKMSALRALGTEEISANGRNYYLTYALEMESGNSPVVRSEAARAHAIKDSPIESVLGMLSFKVQGVTCQYKNFTVGLTFKDESKTFGLTLRNSVCDVIDPLPLGTKTSVSLTTTSQVFKAIVAEDLDIDDEVAKGSVQITSGSLHSYKKFIDCFDPLISI